MIHKIALILGMSLVLALTGAALAQDGEPVSGGTLRAAWSAEWVSLDPHLSSAGSSFAVLANVVEALTDYDDDMQLVGELATSWEQSEDGLTWTFTLLDGVTFSDGDPFTAEDVVWNFQRIHDPTVGSGDVSNCGGEGATFEAVDALTFRITTVEPNAILPVDVAGAASCGIIDPDSVNADGQVVVPVGTGPFVIEEVNGTTDMRLVRNENYRVEGLPYLDAVEISVIPEAAVRETALLGGQVDWIMDPAPQSYDLLKQTEGIEVGEAPQLAYHYVGLNLNREPFSDVRVRQAIAYAINRESHLALFGEPVAQLVYSVVPDALMVGGLSQEEAEEAGVAYHHDPDRARELLAEAGVEDISFELVASEFDSYRRMYEVLQAELAEIGIDVSINIVDHPTYHSLIREGSNLIVVYQAFRPNPDAYFSQFFHSDSIIVTGPSPNTNFARYDQVDDLIEQARAETDADAQIELWKQINIKILEDMAAMPILFINQVYGRSEKVDYGHELVSSLALYPQITELTTINS